MLTAVRNSDDFMLLLPHQRFEGKGAGAGQHAAGFARRVRECKANAAATRDAAAASPDAATGRLWYTRFGWFDSKRNEVYRSLRALIDEAVPSVVKALAQLNVNYAGAADAPSSEASESSMGSSGAAAGGFDVDGNPGWRCKLWRVSHGLGLLLRLLQSQYSFDRDSSGSSPPLSRTAEFVNLAALDLCLGVSGGINCKSGCDRSSMVHAVTAAAHALLAAGTTAEIDEGFQFIANFDAVVQELDAAAGSYQEYMAALVKAAGRGTPKCVAIAVLCEFRNNVMYILVEIGWNIVIQSTGYGRSIYVNSRGR